jgi:hypothetical protein
MCSLRYIIKKVKKHAEFGCESEKWSAGLRTEAGGRVVFWRRVPRGLGDRSQNRRRDSFWGQTLNKGCKLFCVWPEGGRDGSEADDNQSNVFTRFSQGFHKVFIRFSQSFQVFTRLS